MELLKSVVVKVTAEIDTVVTREGVYTVVGTILFTTSVVVVGRSIVVGTRLVRTNVVVV